MTIDLFRNQILHGHVLDKLKEIPDESVHCVVTSPPYWGLRQYGTEPQIWCFDKMIPSKDIEECDHEFIHDNGKHNLGGASEKSTLRATPGQKANEGWTKGVSCEHVFSIGAKPPRQRSSSDVIDASSLQAKSRTSLASAYDAKETSFCVKCGAWRGEFGLEPTPELYIEHLVMIFREIWRVIRKDGTVWLNLGDTYWGSGNSSGHTSETKNLGRKTNEYGAIQRFSMSNKLHLYYKPKDLCMIPARAAIALQADGWYLRSDIIWAKKNPMPESVTDRPSKQHEYIFLLTKSPTYFYDAEAIREEPTSGPSDLRKMLEQQDRIGGKTLSADDPLYKANMNTNIGQKRGVGDPIAGRNKRSVWEVTTTPFPEAHFAVFPEKLIEPCILAGTSEHGVCAECGAPYERILEKTFRTGLERSESETKFDTEKSSAGRLATYRQGARAYDAKYHTNEEGLFLNASERSITIQDEREASKTEAQELYPDDYERQQWYINYVHEHGAVKRSRTIGWRKTCKCECYEVVPSVVLDPFFGSGTTGLVALRGGRDFVGIELNEKYIEIAERRLSLLRENFDLFKSTITS